MKIERNGAKSESLENLGQKLEFLKLKKSPQWKLDMWHLHSSFSFYFLFFFFFSFLSPAHSPFLYIPLFRPCSDRHPPTTILRHVPAKGVQTVSKPWEPAGQRPIHDGGSVATHLRNTAASQCSNAILQPLTPVVLGAKRFSLSSSST